MQINIKNRLLEIEKILGNLAIFIARHPKWIIFSVFLLVFLSASQLPKITVDTSTEGFLHATDPARVAYDEFRNQFGRDEKIVVAISTNDIFKLEKLNQLKALHQRLAAEVPHLFEITSLINARYTQGNGDSLLVDDLMTQWPESQLDAEKLKQKALNNPLYRDLLVDSQGEFTVLVLESNTYTNQDIDSKRVSDNKINSGIPEIPIEETILEDAFSEFDSLAQPNEATKQKEFISDKENSEMVAAVSQIVTDFNSDDFKIYVAGSPSVTAFLKSSIMGDMQKFIVMILAAISIILALLFKRLSGVILPLISVFLAVVVTLGMMAWNGTPIKVMTQVMPSFLLAVGIGASIHVLAIFYKNYDTHKDKEQALIYTFEHSGLAIVMTSLTTAAGMLSFAPSNVAPVADLGIFSALGVMIALLFTLVLLPALLIILPIKSKSINNDSEHHDFLDKFLKTIARFSQTNAKPIVIFSLIFMALSLGAASQIGYSHNPLKWFPPEHETRIATETIDKEMNGSISLELVIDTHQENGLYNLELLKSLDKVTLELQQIKCDKFFVGKALSLVDVLKEIHQALNKNQPEFYRLTSNEKLIPQEILLFENSGSDDLQDFVDSQFSKARITVKVPWIDAFEYDELLNQVAEILKRNLPRSVSITTTGMIPLLAETSSAAVSSSGTSYLIAFAVIGIMLILLLHSVKLGLLAMIPNLLPVLFVLAVMVVFQFPLDLFTMLIGAIVIGIAVDDIVHFMHNFRRFHQQGHSTEKSVEMTLISSGRAMMITTLVLFVGFMLYLFASMTNLFLFGLLTALAFVIALIAVFLLAPALMALTYPEKANQRETL